MKTWGRHCLTWSGHQLFRHGQRAPIAQIEPDETHPGMWRFRLLPDGARSDMVNLARAKDAAAALVLAGLNEAEESGEGRPRMRVRQPPLPRRPSAGRPLSGASRAGSARHSMEPTARAAGPTRGRRWR